MARLATAEALAPSPVDTTAINLERILSRLERTLLSPDGDPKLRSSGFERNKVGANLEHARSLLLRLEHDSADIRIQSKKQSVQVELQAKRELIKRLNQRLLELNKSEDSEEEESELEEDDQDLFPSYAPARKDIDSGLETSQQPSQDALRNAAENLSTSLRARHHQATTVETPPAARPTSTVTGSSFYPSTATATATTATTTTKAASSFGSNEATTEALLSDDRIEQDDLKSSLESMAQLLKQQAHKFNLSLQEDSQYLEQATTGLDKNTAGMGAAGQRMGTLRKMTEGKGWWARLQLYALIAGLWILAFAIVFVFPKFRF